MSERKCTPGPWIVAARDDTTADVVSEDFGTIATVTDYRHNAGRILPDASLIASAPAFLAACRGSDPDVSALEWLAALLTDLRERDYTWCTGDNEAAEAAVVASEALLKALRAAVAQATEEGR